MFVRNFLQAGDFVTIIPAGIRITLQYSEKGSLEAVYVGHGNDQVLHMELLTSILKSDDIPTHLPVTKGTSYVYGCLYTGDIHKVEGKLCTTVETHYISEYLQDPSRFHFFAGHIHSYAAGMNTPLLIQRWMKTRGFNILPSYLIPANFKEDDFAKMVNNDTYPFVFPRISSYILFRNGKYEFVNLSLKQFVVKQIDKITTFDGYILADISSHDMGSLNVSYAEVVNYNIHVGSVLLIDETNKILHCYNDATIKQKHPTTLMCEYCGKIIPVPKTNIRFTCGDQHCVSIMFNRINGILGSLGLDKVALDELKSFAKISGGTLHVPDILDMDKYKDIKLTVDAPQLLKTIVPSSILPRFSDWVIFCNKCNNSVDTILYYLQNSDKMLFDLNLDAGIYKRLFDWLQDVDNLIDVTGMISHPRITVISTGKKFEGAPIFRGKSIYVTGDCIHGNFEEMRAILSSYSAEVYDRFNTAVDCVIIGGLHEGVSGKSIQRARMMNIPIFEEVDFFRQYDIDTDLSVNV